VAVCRHPRDVPHVVVNVDPLSSRYTTVIGQAFNK